MFLYSCLYLCIFGCVSTLVVHENVVFRSLFQFSTSRSKWLASFVIDLKPYNHMITSLEQDVQKTIFATNSILSKYAQQLHSDFYSDLLKNRVQDLDLIRERFSILKSKNKDFETLNNYRKRRSLLPIIGKALSFLFGTVSEDDLNIVKSTVNKLANNQERVIHIVENSLSVLNATRLEISRNRVAINSLVNNLRIFESKFDNLFNNFSSDLRHIKSFLSINSKVEFILNELRYFIENGIDSIDSLHNHLNFLSLGHVSPSVITPSHLSSILLEIKSNIPHSVYMPLDPQKEIWKYYRFLTCTSILDRNHIYVIFNIPLLDSNRKLEIFYAHNLPAPFIQSDITKKQMVANYELESKIFAVNLERSKYALITQSEVDQCQNKEFKFCNIKSPLYPINLSKLCIISLFMDNSQLVKDVCKVMIKPNAILPLAEYLEDGYWAISTTYPLRLSLFCLNKKPTKLSIRPPIDIIRINISCSASNEYLTLLPYYTDKSEYRFQENFPLINLHFIKSAIKIWAPVKQKFFNNSFPKLPKILSTLKEVPIDTFIKDLSNIQSIVEDKAWSLNTYIYIGIGLFFGIAIITTVVYFIRRLKFMSKAAKDRNIETLRAAPKVEHQYHPLLLTSNVMSAKAEGDNTPKGVDNSSSKLMYPPLQLH